MGLQFRCESFKKVNCDTLQLTFGIIGHRESHDLIWVKLEGQGHIGHNSRSHGENSAIQTDVTTHEARRAECCLNADLNLKLKISNRQMVAWC